MKYFILLFLTVNLSAQNLVFDKRNVQCEDKWVTFQMNKDSTYMYGFIYIDYQAGLTFNLEGSFKIDEAGKFQPVKHDKNTMMKARLQPNRVALAIIPESRFAELQIPKVPEWLAIYKTGDGSISRLHRWGFFYNSYGESEMALTYLEKAQKTDPKYKGLAFELAYAYNALKRYEEAMAILEAALKDNPKDCQLYKELSYAEIHTGKLDKAKKTYLKALDLCEDKKVLAEMTMNLAHQYFQKRDLDNFDHWSKETAKWSNGNDIYSQNINGMRKALNE